MKKRVIAVLLVLALMTAAAGCSTSGSGEAGNTETEDGSADAEETDGLQTQADELQTDAEMFTDRDYKTAYDESASVHIDLQGSQAEADSDSVRIEGTRITITEEATYIISGTLDDGMIIVDASDSAKLQIVLDGAEICSETSAPIYILEADKVFITLAEGTENVLSNGGTFTAIDESNIDSVIFSKQDLTLNGSGSLTVASPAGHGIVSNDDLVITGGTYQITSASHGLKANDSVRVTGETALTVTAGKDGIHAENEDDASLGFVYFSGGSVEIEAEGDGISAGSYLQIADGTYQILAGGGSENGEKQSSDSWGEFQGGEIPGRPNGNQNPSMPENPSMPGNQNPSMPESQDLSASASAQAESETEETDSSTSMKGIKSVGNLWILDGNFTIDSADDAVHSNASAAIEGGSFSIASGDDAFHADETLTVTDGTIQISECYEGLEALHVEVSGGEITLHADDDGLNAAGGTDSSGTSGGRDGMFGGYGGGGMGGDPAGGGGASSSDGTIVISGGNLYIHASGDGIDANGSLTISGGYTVVVGPTQGDTATLDYDTTAVITGGTFIGTGASGMAQSFSDSEQGVIAVSVGTQSAGTEITLTDKEGNVLISYAPELSFDVVILSSPDLISGETYTITVGQESGDFEA